MNPTYLSLFANHLWQSTLFAGVAGLLTLALRKNHARARHGVWLAASCKFLIPVFMFIALGGHILWRTAPETTPSNLFVVMDEVNQPFAAPAVASPLLATAPPAASPFAAVLFGIWACGFLGIACSWWVRWWRFRAAVRAGSPLQLEIPIKAMSSATLLEPGVFGVFRPVLLLPEGIFDRLTPAQLKAVIAHELCHVRHRDNLSAAIHMFVETVFWFHPLVWWIGKRMVEERERACDEEVLRLGSEPRSYAEGILKVCEFYLVSPMACASGVTGGELKKRIEGIMANRFTRELNSGKKLLLAVVAVVALAGPMVIGLMNPQRSRAQSHAGKQPSFDVASVKPSPPPTGGRSANYKMSGGPGTKDPSRFACENFDLASLIEMAYDVPDFLLSVPTWTRDRRFDIVAKLPEGTTKEQFRLMQQKLLIERFKLAVHRAKKEMPVFELVVAKGGPKLKDPSAAEPTQESQEPVIPSPLKKDANGFPVLPPGQTAYAIAGGHGRIRGSGETMEHFASTLAGQLREPVIDATGLRGKYDFTLSWLLVDLPPDGDTAPTLTNALPTQLGLMLKRTRGQVNTLVVDHVERTPTEN
jgi:bla regulator protein blaR1